MVPADSGFVAIPREVFESDLYKSMTTDQRMVWLSLYYLANWSPKAFYYGTQEIQVGRGQLAHSIKTISARSGISYDVVRETLRKLSYFHRISTLQNTLPKSRKPRVITILDYRENKEQVVLRAVGNTLQNTQETPCESLEDPLRIPLREDSKKKKINKKETITTLSGRKPDLGVSGLEVFEFWKVKHKHPGAIFTVDRKKAVGAMLAEGYSADQLKLAVSGILQSPHHCGQNDRSTKYLDLTHVCKSGKNVEAFIALATGEDIKPTKINGYSRAEDQHHEIVGTITEWHIPSLDGPDSRRGKEAAGGQGSQGPGAPENVPTSGHP